MSLLTLMNRVQSMVNLPITTTIYSNTGEAQKQLLALSNTSGELLCEEYAWQQLITETSFVTTATAQQTNGALPSDLGWVIDETLWDRTLKQRIYGPMSSQAWQSEQASGVSSLPSRYRIRSGYFYFTPTPAAGSSIYYEYVSNKWCQTSGGTAQAAWSADDNTARIPEQLLILDLAWRWLEAKGLDYTERKNEFDRVLARTIARTGTRTKLSMVRSRYNPIGQGTIPEGSWT